MNIGRLEQNPAPFDTSGTSLNTYDQKHLRCTMVGPDSSYSPLEIHICWNVLNEDKMDPPVHTTLLYKSLRMSTSHFMMDWKVVSWIPLASLPTKLGWKRTSGQRKRSLPTVMMLPSGSS